jgi:adenine-specific DNA-methyltransferase
MPPKKKPSTPKSTAPIPVTTVKHKDKRTNIPTEELRDFVSDDEKNPKTVLYPRDPSLDPQLVWKGKDEQDRHDLAVPAVPIYIQERIQPQAIIENIKAQAKKENPAEQMTLFSDFNGIEFEELIDFYHHEQSWTNRMILGDSLMVMASLAEKEGLKGKVQMIYIDPPYGIKFGSNWQVSTRKRDVKDGRAEDATRQPEQIKAFRDTWQLGIHSYLAYLRDRLVAAHELLTESGSVFVQISDENVHLVRSLLDETFGSLNFIAFITFATTTGQTSEFLANPSDYLLWYAKNSEQVKFRRVYTPKSMSADGNLLYTYVELPNGERRSLTSEEKDDPSLLPKDSRPYMLGDFTSQRQNRPSGPGTAMYFPVEFENATYYPTGNRGWTTTTEGIQRMIHAGKVRATSNTLRLVRYFDDFPYSQVTSLWTDTSSAALRDKIYVVQTNERIVERCMLMTTDPGDLVLDPTCGSGTTAYVAEQWGRRWITIDTSRVAIALARTRLMTAKYPYYLLADSPEGTKLEMEASGSRDFNREFTTKVVTTTINTTGDIKRGFVYKRVPHVTLKSIANNEEIDAIHAKWQETLDPLRAKINRVAKQKWEEWEIPRAVENGDNDLKSLLQTWWQARRDRQKEIDASIAKRADTELLYDQPYEDNKRIRVTGPFTVESLSPHRVLAADEERPASEAAGQQATAGQFTTLIIDNLKKAGVQNTVKKERLKFDQLESYAGVWLHATGDYTDADGKSRRVAVSIGPESGTVGPLQIKEAAKEAVQGVGFDLLIVCGFAFDPHVTEEVKRYGKLTVLTARMNPDLAMGEELLKKTGAGNLFMVFGEPDLKVKPDKDGKLTVEIKGVDVYDPTTGAIRSSSTDDIACWFIDTDYNGESFFVRHAYFTGEGDPYDRLKRALRAEIDEAAWSALYSTKSYPFDKPTSGKIAVKVINHYGDEVLKVYEVE